ncbi:30S ribosomal protein S6e [Candidatus Pacearchaeota archaeon]|nr:30S ribosomal protein S6e [Candidatus Pacearchaeota archaeon]
MFKINISEKGKSWKLETDTEALVGRKIGEKISGSEISSELSDYELEITGTSDKAGFPGFKEIESSGLKRVLLVKGKGMWSKPKGLKKKKPKMPDGLRLKKTVRGSIISRDVVQINLKVLKHGKKKLEEIFPEQNKPKEQPKTEEKKEVQAQ